MLDSTVGSKPVLGSHFGGLSVNSPPILEPMAGDSTHFRLHFPRLDFRLGLFSLGGSSDISRRSGIFLLSRPERSGSRSSFLKARIPLLLYPFLNAASSERPIEFLRLTSLGVIGALVKVDDPDVMSFLLQTEIIPLCLLAWIFEDFLTLFG